MRFKIVGLIIVLILAGLVFVNSDQLNIFPSPSNLPLPTPPLSAADIFSGVSYEAVNPEDFSVSLFAENLASPTRLKLSLDGKHLLVSLITGEVVAFDRTASGWNQIPYAVTKVETKFPGFPPDEAGLVGMTFSSRFAENGKLFLLYTFRDQDGSVKNRVSVTRLSEKQGRLVGSKPELVYEANVAGSGSHQITDAVAVEIADEPHLLILVGEGFDAQKAQDPTLEAGKAILITEEGNDPRGPRPYEENLKVEAIGIRNAYVLLKNHYDPQKRILIGDTGPSKYDRLLYTRLATGEDQKPLNFGWNGNEEDLTKAIPDPNDARVSDMVILRLPETRTFTGLAIHKGKGAIPASTPETQSILATIFGKTGEPGNSQGKEIWLGRLQNLSGQPSITFTPIIKRVAQSADKLGNPIGLTIDEQTGNFLFADILEGRIYLVEVRGGE